jgi:two-component system, OmpR family, sensor kinase
MWTQARSPLRLGNGAGAQVFGDAADLSRALRNLLDNAIAHSPQGASIMIDARIQASEVLITVEDEGPGVLLEDAPHLFVPFWRGKEEQGNQSGAGLGLSIAREIAVRHGGDIQLEPRVRSKGARFVLSLPLAS